MVERFYIGSVIWTSIICGYCQAARSTEFEAMFRNVESKIIEVAEMSLEELNAFVSFFYKATIDANVLLKHSPALLQAANKYKVDFLTSICEEALVTNISKENVISKFFVAKKHCSEAVMEAVLKEATTLGDVSTFTEYKKYSQTDAGLLLEFYEKLARLKKAKGSKRRRVGKGKLELFVLLCVLVRIFEHLRAGMLLILLVPDMDLVER